jgi:hypothetical protein
VRQFQLFKLAALCRAVPSQANSSILHHQALCQGAQERNWEDHSSKRPIRRGEAGRRALLEAVIWYGRLQLCHQECGLRDMEGQLSVARLLELESKCPIRRYCGILPIALRIESIDGTESPRQR